MTHNFDSYVDSLQVDLNQAHDTARAKFTSGGMVSENVAGRGADGLHVQLRSLGYLPQAVALADN